jgi:hypothetical protein
MKAQFCIIWLQHCVTSAVMVKLPKWSREKFLGEIRGFMLGEYWRFNVEVEPLLKGSEDY